MSWQSAAAAYALLQGTLLLVFLTARAQSEIMLGTPRGVAQFGLERGVWVAEVAGSNPVAPSFVNEKPFFEGRGTFSLDDRELRFRLKAQRSK